jgi:hypothetical protein
VISNQSTGGVWMLSKQCGLEVTRRHFCRLVL